MKGRDSSRGARDVENVERSQTWELDEQRFVHLLEVPAESLQVDGRPEEDEYLDHLIHVLCRLVTVPIEAQLRPY